MQPKSENSTLQHSKQIESSRIGIKSALYGGAAGLFSSVVLQPLDVIKTNLIILPKNLAHLKNSKNPLSSFYLSSQYIYQNRGASGFWIGTIPAIGKGVTSASTFFFLLPIMKKFLHEDLQYSQYFSTFMASGTARCASTIIANPFTVIKTRMLLYDKMSAYPTIGVAAKKIFLQEGGAGFLKGGLTVLMRDFPFGAIFFTTYTIMSDSLIKVWDNKLVYLGCGTAAGILATVLTQPFEIVRIVFQANEGKRSVTKSTRDIGKPFQIMGKSQIWGILNQAYKEEGMWFCTKGLLPRLVRKPLVNATTLFFYEVMTREPKAE